MKSFLILTLLAAVSLAGYRVVTLSTDVPHMDVRTVTTSRGAVIETVGATGVLEAVTTR